MRIIKYKFTQHSVETDKPLTISLPPNIEKELSLIHWDLTCDITLNKSMYIDRTKLRVTEQNWVQQRRFLLSIYESFPEVLIDGSELAEIFIVFEIQANTNNIHAHSNVRFHKIVNEIYVQGFLRNLVCKAGVKIPFIQYIRYPKERFEYIMKSYSKLPSHVYHSVKESEEHCGNG